MAILKFPAPTNLIELRIFMGIVHQMSGHSKEVSEAALPLQPLMKKKNTFQWMGLRKKDLKKPMDQTIWAANQSKFRKCGRLKVKVKFQNNEIEEQLTLVQEPLEPSLIFGWNTSRLLRNDVEYPKCLKVNNVSTVISALEIGDDKIPSDPTAREIECIR